VIKIIKAGKTKDAAQNKRYGNELVVFGKINLLNILPGSVEWVMAGFMKP